MLEGKIVGARRSAREGEEDRQVRLRRADRRARGRRPLHAAGSASTPPDLRFLYVLAVPNTAAMAREVVEALRQRHRRASGRHRAVTCSASTSAARSIELLANPGYREVTYAPAGPIPAVVAGGRARVSRASACRSCPRIDISIMEEGQARWLAFLNGEIDYLGLLPVNLIGQALADGKLRPELAAKGILHQVLLRPSVGFTYFNMEDPVVGGYDAGAHRAAPRDRHGATTTTRRSACCTPAARCPPAARFRRTSPATTRSSRPRAQMLRSRRRPRALLDKFGYKDRDGDGYRETPDGQAAGHRALVAADVDRARARRTVEEEPGRDRHPRRRSSTTSCRNCARWRARARSRCATTAGMPTIRTPRTSCSCCTARPSARPTIRASTCRNSTSCSTRRGALPDSPERTRLFDRMTELVVAYAPWRVRVNDIEDTLAHAVGPQLRAASDAQRRAGLHGRRRGAAREARKWIAAPSAARPFRPCICRSRRRPARRSRRRPSPGTRRARHSRTWRPAPRRAANSAAIVTSLARILAAARGAKSPASARGMRSAKIQLPPELALITSTTCRGSRPARTASASASAPAARFTAASRLLTILNLAASPGVRADAEHASGHRRRTPARSARAASGVAGDHHRHRAVGGAARTARDGRVDERDAVAGEPWRKRAACSRARPSTTA